MKQLLLGTIIGSHGLKGEFKFVSFSHFIDERLQEGNVVYIGKNEETAKEYEVEEYKFSPKFVILKIKGIDAIEDADKLKSLNVYVNKEEIILEDGYFFYDDLEECKVVDEDNNLLGKVIKLEEFPAQVTLRVKHQNGKEFFVPYIEQFVIETNIKEKIIKIKVIGGML